jgi:hypothetical protein
VVLSLLWLTSDVFFSETYPLINRYSKVSLNHKYQVSIKAALEDFVRPEIDLVLIESGCMDDDTEKSFNIIQKTSAFKLLFTTEPEVIILALKKGIDLCVSPPPSEEEIKHLIKDVLNLKKKRTKSSPFSNKIILPNSPRNENLNIIPWDSLISIHSYKNKTRIHQKNIEPYENSLSLNKIRKKYLSSVLFYNLKEHCSINLNHLNQINFISSNNYECKLSDGRSIEINAMERNKLIKYLGENS